MKTILIFIVAIILSLPIYSQNFKNQGEQEIAWTVTFFKEKYAKQTFEKFKGAITEINENQIRYEDFVLQIYIENQDLKTIFTKGIFYPQIFTGNGKPEELVGNGEYRITSFKQLNFPDIYPKSRRFMFWLFTKDIANPSVYFIELTNEEATINMDIRTFISNSKLTFAKGGRIII
jgi:hypothetical protein